MNKRGERPLPQFVYKDFKCVSLGISRMNDHRQASLPCDIYMHAEQLLLNSSIRMLVIIVEPGLADANYPGVLSRSEQHAAPKILMIVSLMRMNAYAGKNVTFARGRSDDLLPFLLLG